MSQKLVFSISIVSGIAALIVVLGVLLYTNIWSPAWNPFRLKPAEVMGIVAQKMANVDNYHLKTDFQLTDSQNQGIFSLSFDGTTDKSKKDFRKKDYIFSVKISALGQPMLIAGEEKTLGDVSYVKITSFPSLPILAILGFNPSLFQGKWVRIDKNSLAEARNELGVQRETNQELSPEKKKVAKQLTDLFNQKKAEIVKIVKELNGEKINGHNTYHYLVQGDMNQLKSFLQEANNIILRDSSFFGTDKEKKDWQNFTTVFFQSYDDIVKKLGDINFEIWVGKSDKLLYRVKLDKEVDLTKFARPETLQKMSLKKVEILLDINFSNFNKKVNITAPQKAVDIKDIISGMGFTQNLLQQYQSATSATSTLKLFNNRE